MERSEIKAKKLLEQNCAPLCSSLKPPCSYKKHREYS